MRNGSHSVNAGDLERTEQFIRQLAGWSKDAPTYVVLRSQLPADFPWPRNADSWTAADLDLWLRPWLEEAGAWRGRGFCTVLGQLSPGTSFLQVVIHELAHCLAEDWSYAQVTDARSIP